VVADIHFLNVYMINELVLMFRYTCTSSYFLGKVLARNTFYGIAGGLLLYLIQSFIIH
jgi:hypothetical protein